MTLQMLTSLQYFVVSKILHEPLTHLLTKCMLAKCWWSVAQKRLINLFLECVSMTIYNPTPFPCSPLSLHRRHNQCYGISKHWHFNCLLNHFFRCISKKTSKLHISGLCDWNSPLTGGFLSQRTSNSENDDHLVMSSCEVYSSSHLYASNSMTLHGTVAIAFLSTGQLTGISLGMRPANERCRYTVMMSLIGWVHT